MVSDCLCHHDSTQFFFAYRFCWTPAGRVRSAHMASANMPHPRALWPQQKTKTYDLSPTACKHSFSNQCTKSHGGSRLKKSFWVDSHGVHWHTHNALCVAKSLLASHCLHMCRSNHRIEPSLGWISHQCHFFPPWVCFVSIFNWNSFARMQESWPVPQIRCEHSQHEQPILCIICILGCITV